MTISSQNKSLTRTFFYTTTLADEGVTLLQCLKARFPSYSEDSFVCAVDNKSLLVNENSVSLDFVLTHAMTIQYTAPILPEPEVDDSYNIIFQDSKIAVVNKSGNMPCHPAGRYYDNTLSLILQRREKFPNVFFVNRIDRETSGIVLVAKDAETASRLGKKAMMSGFQKNYLVAVEGDWGFQEEWHHVCGKITLASGTTVRKKRVFVECEKDSDEKGKFSETYFKKVYSCKTHSLLEARPITGRPHQIRATLKAIGFPVVGDKLYGIDENIYSRMNENAMTESDIKNLRISRQALHSWKLKFRYENNDVEFVAPLPDDMKRLQEM